MNKYHKMLELDTIIELIKNEAVLKSSKIKLDKIELLDNLQEIEQLLNEVDEAVILLQRMQRVPIFIHSDLSFILSKVHKYGILNPEEVLEVSNLLDTIKENYLYLERCETAEIDVKYIDKIIEQMTYNKDLNLKIKTIVNPFGEIKDDASSLLKDLRRKQIDTEKNIKNKLQEIVQKNANKLTQSLVSFRNDRYVIPVKNEYKNTFKGIIHDQSASGETVFIEPMIINELNNRLLQLKEAEKTEINQILRKISVEINEYYDDLLTSYNAIVYLDITYAKANYAIKINASKPIINKEGIVDLLNCRHPLLNVENVVSNNVRIGKDYQGIIITGPNTGGKTVLLKTVGLLSLMIKIGMLIPCDANSKIMIFDDVFSDIGDEQSIDQNLSTFSSHLTNIIEIINQVTKNSLVLLDELGSGTDPVEGSSLAISIFEYLINRNCLLIATSHYSELKIHAYNSNNIINASVEFNEVTLKPTYKLLIGVPGMSNALKIARTLGLKTDIIDSAESYVYQKNDNLNNMLDKLIKQSHELDNKLKEVEQNKQEITTRINDLDQEKRKIKLDEQKIINNANKEAAKLIEKTKGDINQLFEEIKQLKNRQIKPHEIADLTHKIKVLDGQHIEERDIEEDLPLEVNSQVYVKNYDAYGTIIKKLNQNRFEVLIGNVSVKVDKKHLQSSKEQTTKPKTQNHVIPQSFQSKAASSLDLRGKRYEDAISIIDKFIDDAIYANLNTISFIHGYGTGAIRKLVQDILKNNKFIESYRYGGSNEGGQGITVATLKK